MRLAWHNIAFNRTRFAVTVLGIAAAVFLIVFQGSILTGFLEASSKIIDSADADIWIMARGVGCFEFPAPIEKRFVEIAHSVGGVSGATPICTRAAQFRKADGSHQVVALVGAALTFFLALFVAIMVLLFVGFFRHVDMTLAYRMIAVPVAAAALPIAFVASLWWQGRQRRFPRT